MPLSPHALDRFLARLTAARPVTHKKMFGGAGFYVGATFFAVADDDRLWFKVDEVTEPAFVARGCAQWTLTDKDGTRRGQPYREIPGDVLVSDAELGVWIDDSVGAAQRRRVRPKSS